MTTRELVKGLQLFPALVIRVSSLMAIEGTELPLAVLNGAVPVRSVRGKGMKRLANPEAVMWMGAGIIIVIGVLSSAIIYLCM